MGKKKKHKYKDMQCSKCGNNFNARPHSIYAELDMCRECIVKVVKKKNGNNE